MPLPGLQVDLRLEQARSMLRDRLAVVAEALEVASFRELMARGQAQTLADAFVAVGASEGTLWIIDAPRQHLVPAYNSGPRAAEFLERITQPLDRGIISMVVATEAPFCENEVSAHTDHDPAVDTAMQLRTESMIAVPFVFGGRVRGVVSCVKLRGPGLPEGTGGFLPAHVAQVDRAAAVLAIQLEHRLVRAVLEWPNPA